MNPSTHLLQTDSAVLRAGDGVASGPREPQLVHVESGSVAVHEYHGGGKVKPARHEDPDGRLGVEGLTGHHPGRVEVVASLGEHQDGEEGHGHDPGHAYDGHAALEC